MLAFPKTVIHCSICKTSNCNMKGKSALLLVFSLVWGQWGQSPFICTDLSLLTSGEWLTWGLTRIFSGGSETTWLSNTGISAYWFHSATSTIIFTNKKVRDLLVGERGWFFLLFCLFCFEVFVSFWGVLVFWFFFKVDSMVLYCQVFSKTFS